MTEVSVAVRLRRFAVGLSVLGTGTGWLMSGAVPPGVCGEVLRHNRSHQIDASALFYSEVENMQALEEGARQMRLRVTPAPASPDTDSGGATPSEGEPQGPSSPPAPARGR